MGTAYTGHRERMRSVRTRRSLPASPSRALPDNRRQESCRRAVFGRLAGTGEAVNLFYLQGPKVWNPAPIPANGSKTDRRYRTTATITTTRIICGNGGGRGIRVRIQYSNPQTISTTITLKRIGIVLPHGFHSTPYGIGGWSIVLRG